MKRISLTKGKTALVSDGDFSRLRRWRWYAQRDRRTWYAARMERRTGKRITVLMHREILGLRFGDKTQGDHKDGNKLNNQRRNLRKATELSNRYNRRKYRTNTSGFKGVAWHARRAKWQAQLTAFGKHLSLGYFTKARLAAKAYDVAAKRAFGKFASLNFS